MDQRDLPSKSTHKVGTRKQIPEDEESVVAENSSDSIAREDRDAILMNLIQAIAELERRGETSFPFIPVNKNEDLNSLPPKEYLDATVVPILLYCLELLNKSRPTHPLRTLCLYLLQFRDKFDVNAQDGSDRRDQGENNHHEPS